MTQYCYITTSEKWDALRRKPKALRVVRECSSDRLYVYTRRRSAGLQRIADEKRLTD